MDDRNGKPARSSTDETDLARRLRELSRKIDERSTEPRADEEAPARAGMAMGLRLAADFVAGVAVGGALGWGFDRLLGTSPWGLIVFLILGFAAGTLNVLRSAGLVKPGPMGPEDRSGTS